MNKRSFASDNNAGIHPKILAAIAEANAGHVRGYGNDEYTAQAEAAVRRLFGNARSVHFVYNGTGGNVIGLQSLLRPYEPVICTASSRTGEETPRRAVTSGGERA